MSAIHGKTNRKVAAAGFLLGMLAVLPQPVCGGDLLFEPYRCRTAITGVEFSAPPPKLRKSQSGVRYRRSRGPDGLSVDPDSGAVRWASPAEGRHVIRVVAAAGPDSDEIEWILRVVPKAADDLVVHSTKYLDFVLPKRKLQPDVYLHRTDYLDGIWECYYRLIGQEPLSDLQVLRWSPGVNGALAGNPIQFGGTAHYSEPEWHESEWLRYGVEHELAHNFNALIRTPGTWSSEKFSEGFGKPWLDLYLHHLCDNDIFVLQHTAISEPKLFGFDAADLKSYRAFAANSPYHRLFADAAKKHRELIQSGKSMQEAAESSSNSTWQHLIGLIVQRDGVEVIEGAFRAMRHDGLPDEIFQDATTPERKFSLLVSLFSASAKRDLRPFFADWGLVVEQDYYDEIHPRVQAEMKKLLPKDVWVDGWIKSPVNGHLYRVLTWKTDREQASRTARQWGGRLLEVHSSAEQEWLARRYSHLGPVWLGLSDEAGSREWTWDSGERATEAYWNPNGQKNLTNHCAVLGKPEPRGSWHQFKESHNCTVIVERINGVDSLAQARPRASSAPKGGVLTVSEARSKGSEVATVPLEELPQQDGYNSAPWVSADGLTLYWQSTAKGEKQRSIWCAERKTADSQFSNARKLLPGSDPTLTGDELEMIFLDGRDLYLATRKTKKDDFDRPRKIPELNGLGFLAAPCLSEDGLLLWADRVGGKAETVRFQRPTRDAAWGRPEVVKMPLIGSIGRFVYVDSKDGYGFCCVPDLLKDKSANNLVYLSTKDQGATFTNPVVVEVPKEVVRGKFPRYVEATRELFFSGDLEESGRARLFVIRNFDRSALTKE